MKRLSFLLHALSPLHCGTGQGVDIVDLPIARMRSTGIPIAPGSSLKGVLRAHASSKVQQEPEKIFAVFGPETNHASENVGALVVGDARLLMLPVRSFMGAFAWVTSPLLLRLAQRDFAVAEHATVPNVPALDGRGALVADIKAHANVQNAKVYLEDLDLAAKADLQVGAWAALLKQYMPSTEHTLLESRLVVVDDETMAFLWETATQIDARNRIDSATGTVTIGALWYEESLPPETILIGQLAAEKSRRASIAMSADEVLAFAVSESQVIQVGGKSTVGRGICKIYVAR